MPGILQHITEHKKDAILWQAERWINAAGDVPHERGKAIDRISVLLACIQHKASQTAYTELVAKSCRIKIKELREFVVAEQEKKKKSPGENWDEEDDFRFPPWCNEEMQKEVLHHGFTERVFKNSTGYYFKSDGNSLVQRTNFVITPLYHIYGQDNRRMLSVTNGHMSAVVELQSKTMIEPGPFLGELFNQGNFQQKEGFTKNHLVKILGKYGDSFPLAYELNNLGWQNKEGFFAFANTTYRPPAEGEREGR